jgi:hypothetical protein
VLLSMFSSPMTGGAGQFGGGAISQYRAVRIVSNNTSEYDE